MKITDLKIIIENPKGSYKKFADSLDEYPLLGVTYPTDYGYIEGYESEDGHDLDVFVGSGGLLGVLRINRDDFPNGVEAKFIINATQDEFEAIENEFKPVVNEIKKLSSEEELLRAIEIFKS